MADHSGHRGRVKSEFLARGVEGWSDHRVLELLLFYAIPQGDVNGLAHELIEHFGSISGVLDASVDELKKCRGVGEHTAVLLKAVTVVAQRYEADRSKKGNLIHNYLDAADELRPHFFAARNEMAYALCLDSKGKCLGVRRLSEGCITATSINIRRLLEEVLSLRASRVYLAHNHVSQIALPSIEDWSSTGIVEDTLERVGVALEDHLIFVDGDFVSLRASGWRNPRRTYEIN